MKEWVLMVFILNSPAGELKFQPGLNQEECVAAATQLEELNNKKQDDAPLFIRCLPIKKMMEEWYGQAV